MAKLLEYQGKELFRRFKIPTPPGQVARCLEEALAAAAQIGYPVVVKAQILAGKRGKGGGIRPAANEAELRQVVEGILGSQVCGLPVEILLIEKKLDIVQELYVGVIADPALRAPTMVVCTEGGISIEETAQERPEALIKMPVDILRGVYFFDALNVLRSVTNLSPAVKTAVAQVISGLYQVYRTYDCKLAEINPLAVTAEGVVALDARVDIDGDSVSRHPELNLALAEEAGDRQSTLLERIAGTIDHQDHRGTVHFVQVDPDLSYARTHDKVPFGFDCVGAGASLTMMDELVPLGYYPVNFCDSSGNPVGSKLYRITKVIFSQPGIEGYVFASCVSSQQLDNTARGIIKALKELYPETRGQPNIPTVLAFRGAWDEDAARLLQEHGISDGRWVRVLGRNSTEKDAAEAFRALHREWRAERGGAR